MSRSKPEVYFYLKSGKVTGPIYLDDVRTMIDSGELSSMELLYSESEKVWKPVGEFSELSDEAENPKSKEPKASEVSSEDPGLDLQTITGSVAAELEEEKTVDDYEDGAFVGLGVSDESFADFKDPDYEEQGQQQVEDVSGKGASPDVEGVRRDVPVSSPEDGANKGWVVLRKKPGYSDKYDQIGPISSDQVYEMISKGQLGFQDFVWTDGYKGWVLITEDESFKGKVAFWGQEEPKLPDVPSVSIQTPSENVELKIDELEPIAGADVDEIIDRSSVDDQATVDKAVSKKPEEAEGPDLAKALDLPEVGESSEDLSSDPSGEDQISDEVSERSFSIRASQVGRIEDLPDAETDPSALADGTPTEPIAKAKLAENTKKTDKTSTAKGGSKSGKQKDSLAEEVSLSPLKRWLVISLNVALLSGVVAMFIYAAFGPSLKKMIFSKRQISEDVTPLSDPKGTAQKPDAGRPQSTAPNPKVAQSGQGKVSQKVSLSVKEPAPRVKPKPQPKPKIKPTYISVKTVKMTSKSATLRFTSDGSEHFVVSFELNGRAGATLTPGAYRRVFRVPLQGGKRELKLDQARVPDGNFSYVAKIGDIKKKGSFFKGKSDKQFRDQRFQVRKSLSPQHQVEKMNLIGEALKVRGLCQSLDKAAKKGVVSAALKTQLKKVASRVVRRVSAQLKGSILWRSSWLKLKQNGIELQEIEKAIPGSGKVGSKAKKAAQSTLRDAKRHLAEIEGLNLFR